MEKAPAEKPKCPQTKVAMYILPRVSARGLRDPSRISPENLDHEKLMEHMTEAYRTVQERRGLDSVDINMFCCVAEKHADGAKHFHVAMQMTRSHMVPAVC